MDMLQILSTQYNEQDVPCIETVYQTQVGADGGAYYSTAMEYLWLTFGSVESGRLGATSVNAHSSKR